MQVNSLIKQIDGCPKREKPCLQTGIKTYGYEACKLCASNYKNLPLAKKLLLCDYTGFLNMVAYKGGWLDVRYKENSIGTIRNGSLDLKRITCSIDNNLLDKLLSYETQYND